MGVGVFGTSLRPLFADWVIRTLITMCFCLPCSEISSVAACMFQKIYFLIGGTKTIGVVFLSVLQISDDLTFFPFFTKNDINIFRIFTKLRWKYQIFLLPKQIKFLFRQNKKNVSVAVYSERSVCSIWKPLSRHKISDIFRYLTTVCFSSW